CAFAHASAEFFTSGSTRGQNRIPQIERAAHFQQAILPTLPKQALSFQRPQRTADAGDDVVPGPLLLARIDQIEAMDRTPRSSGEVAAAVEDQALAGR